MDHLELTIARTEELKLVVPRELRFESGYLEWRHGSPTQDSRWGESQHRSATPTLLSAFARLSGGTHDQIANFAARYGVLGICEHGEPAPHLSCPPCLAPDMETHTEYRATTWFREQLWSWRYWAKRLSGAVEVATALRRGRVAPPEAWRRLDRGDPGPVSWVVLDMRLPTGRSLAPSVPHPASTWTLDQAQKVFAKHLDDLVAQAGLQPASLTTKNETIGRFGLRNNVDLGRCHPLWNEGALFPALIVALVNFIRDDASIIGCSMCSEVPEIPKHGGRPRGDRRVFCSEQCRIESRRARDRERRRRGRI